MGKMKELFMQLREEKQEGGYFEDAERAQINNEEHPYTHHLLQDNCSNETPCVLVDLGTGGIVCTGPELSILIYIKKHNIPKKKIYSIKSLKFKYEE